MAADHNKIVGEIKMKYLKLKVIVVLLGGFCLAIFGVPQPTDREDKKPELSKKICEKSPVKDLLEGKIPWGSELSGNDCKAQLRQVQARKEAIKHAIECAKAKLKKFKTDIEKLRGEVETLVNSDTYKQIQALEREVIRCKKCTSVKCPASNAFCGGITSTPITPLPLFPFGGIGDIGGCGMAMDFHQPCTGGVGGLIGLRGFLNNLRPPNCEQCRAILCCKNDPANSVSCPPPDSVNYSLCARCISYINCNTSSPQSCCERVYNACREKGWMGAVEGCENPPQPQSSKNSVQQKLQEIQLLLLHGKCHDVIQKLPDLINEVKEKAKVPTLPPPTYDELCKDINVDDATVACMEAQTTCQLQCTKDKNVDKECFDKCMNDAGCKPQEDGTKCTKNEDCAKITCPPATCIPEKPCSQPVPVCENNVCTCKATPAGEDKCDENLKRLCTAMRIPCMPSMCKPCFPDQVCIDDSLNR